MTAGRRSGTGRGRHGGESRYRRGALVVSLVGTSVGAFLAFGLGPLAGAPPARADFDALIGDLLNPADWGAVFDASNWNGLSFDPTTVGNALAVSSTVDTTSLTGAVTGGPAAPSVSAIGGLDGVGSNSTEAGVAGSAQELPPIACTGTILDPSLEGFYVAAPSLVSCTGPALIGIFSELFYDHIPIGIPGIGLGFTSAHATTASLFCIPGAYVATMAATVIFPPGYTPITPDTQFDVSKSDDITCS